MLGVYDMNACLDENYADTDYLEQLKLEGYDLLKKINGYVKYLKTRKQTELVGKLTI